MTRQARGQRCPESVLGWIPWYADGGLNDRQRGAVESHAAECSECRAELDMIFGAPFEIDVALPDPERVFREITSRIDAGEGEALPAALPTDLDSPLGEEEHGVIARWARDESDPEMDEVVLTASDRAARVGRFGQPVWVAAAAILLVCLGGLGGAVLSPVITAEPSLGAYELAAAAEAAPGRDLAAFVDVVFSEAASASEISDALRGLGVEIVSGPSSLGVYRLRLTAEGTDPRTSGAADAAAIATRLKALDEPIVVFAEPVP